MLDFIKKNNETDFIEVMENALKRAEINYSYKDINTVRMFILVFTANNLPHIELKMIVEPDGDMTDRICLAKNVDINKQSKILLLLNKLNEQYRFAKFVLDKDNDLYIYRDDRLQCSSNDWCDRMLANAAMLVRIADESAPEIMMLVWGDISDEIEQNKDI